MKFLDANILVYAYFKPSRKLKPEEKELKKKSRRIVKRIDKDEEVATSTVHLSEIANILATCFSSKDFADLLIDFQTKGNVEILNVSAADYLVATQRSKETDINLNDCLAAVLMKNNHIKEIYTFDKDFEIFDWVEIKTK